MKKKSNRKKNSRVQTQVDPKFRCWSDIPVDLSRSVAERLIYPDFIRFRAVCKNWRLAFSHDDDLRRRAVLALVRTSCHSNHHFHIATLCTSRFFDMLPPLQVLPIRSVIQEQEKVPKERIVYPTFCCSYSDWLLLVQSSGYYKPRNYTLFVHSPLQKETIHELDLPDDDDWCWPYLDRAVEVAGFSSNPSSGDCVIFLVWKYGRDEFVITTSTMKHQNKEKSSRSTVIGALPRKDFEFIKDVVYVNGSFYCALGRKSKVVLGAFNLALQEWVIMTKKSLKLPSRPEQVNLVKSDGGLILLAVCYRIGDEFFYHIYQFDLSREEWTRVQSLGNQVLMLRSCSSVATPAVGVIGKLANMIFARLSDSESYVAFTWETEGQWRWRQLYV